MSLTSLLLPAYKQMLHALYGWLEKAEGAAEETDGFLSAQLAPDMLPLSAQVRFCCIQAREGVFRLRGEALSPMLDELMQEARVSGEQPGSVAEAQARITETLAFLDGISEGALDEGAQKLVSIELPSGMIFDMTGEQYARDWALPQFYFHLNTAYAILRHKGVELGKADYVSHAFQYLREGTAA